MAESTSAKVLKSSIIVALVISAFMLVFVSRYILLMSIIGIGLGVLVSPFLSYMRSKFRLPRVFSAFVFLIFAAGFGFIVFYAISYMVSDQIQTLTAQWPALVDNLQTRWVELIDRFPWLADRLKGVDVSTIARNSLSPFLSWIKGGFTLASGFLFALVIGIYTAVGAKEYQLGTVNLFPTKMRGQAASILSKCAITLRRWFRAQMLDVVIMGLITMIGLWIIGAEYWAVFGLLTAIFGLIPYLGIFIVIALASLVTLASDPAQVPWVLGVFFITQQIEGNIILPYVMKSQVELPEVPLLILMFLMATWFGLLGVFLATPMFAVLRVLYLELYVPRMRG